MRPIALLPIACSIAGVVLGFLCIFAGSKPNMMEDYYIVSLNTSSLGHVLVNSTMTSSNSASPTPTSLASWLTSSVSSAAHTLESDLSSAEGDLADKLAADLGISQWYSLHMLDLCEGTYSPNATTPGASVNVTSCTNRTALFNFDPTEQINHELANGPLHINTSTLNWPPAIQDNISKLNSVMAATFIFYVVGVGLSALTFLMALITLFLPDHPACLTPFLLATLAIGSFIALGIASGAVTAAMVKIAAAVNNDGGQEIGVVAYRGNKYLALTWAATGVMLVAVVGVLMECCCGRRRRVRREYKVEEIRGI